MKKLKKPRGLKHYQDGGQDATSVKKPLLQPVYKGYGNQNLPEGFFNQPGVIKESDDPYTLFPQTQQGIRNATHSTNLFKSIPAGVAQSFGNLMNPWNYARGINSDQDLRNNLMGAGMDIANVFSPIVTAAEKTPFAMMLDPKQYIKDYGKRVANYLQKTAPRRLEGRDALEHLIQQNPERYGNPIGNKSDLTTSIDKGTASYKGNTSAWSDMEALKKSILKKNPGLVVSGDVSGSFKANPLPKEGPMTYNEQMMQRANVVDSHERWAINKMSPHQKYQYYDNIPKGRAIKHNLANSAKAYAEGDVPFYDPQDPFRDMRSFSLDLGTEYPDKYGAKEAYMDISPFQKGGPIIDPQGQYNHPGKITQIPGNNITMKNIPYRMYAKPDKGPGTIMYPDQEYHFPGASHVTEYPMARSGGHPSAAKAQEMLTNPPKNQPMTKKQVHYFQALAHGWNPKQMGGGMGEHLSVFPMTMQQGGDKPMQRWYEHRAIVNPATNDTVAQAYYQKFVGSKNPNAKAVFPQIGSYGRAPYVRPITKTTFDLQTDTAKWDSAGNYVPVIDRKWYDSKGNPLNIKQDGGSSEDQFPDDNSFAEQKKNDFLSWLQNTSMEAQQEQMMEQYGYMKKGGHWIQGAVNPKHKGYCTPITKSTCTPRRKAFAMTMKKHHGFHQDGGFTPYRKDANAWAMQDDPERFNGYEVDNRNPFFDPMHLNTPTDVKNLKMHNNDPYHPAWDFIPNTGQKWQPHTNMSWMDKKDPNKLDYSPQQGFPQGQSFGMPPKQSAMNMNSDYYKMENVNQRASNASGESQSGRPNWKDRWWATPEILNAGMGFATNFIENFPGGAQDRLKKWNKMTTTADWMNSSTEGSRGDYTPNQGYLRPDQTTPVQYYGQDGGEYQEGGEYDMSPEELDNFLRDGGEVEIID